MLRADIKLDDAALSSSSANGDGCDDGCFEKRIKCFTRLQLAASLPLVQQMFQVLLTVPTNTVSCERMFSSLRRLKNFTRSRCSDERLSDLALLHVERDIAISFDDLLDSFDSQGDRRLALH